MERRSLAPFGLLGGKSGLRGKNTLIRKLLNGKSVYLGGKTTVKVKKGDHVIIMTPGGGGFGLPANGVAKKRKVDFAVKSTTPSILTGSAGIRQQTQETN